MTCHSLALCILGSAVDMRRTAVVGALRAAIRPAEPIMVKVKMAGRKREAKRARSAWKNPEEE